MRDDLDNASFGPEHFAWLWKSLVRSVRAVFSTPWAWGPAVGLTLLSLFARWHAHGWMPLDALNAEMLRRGADPGASVFVDIYVDSASRLMDPHLLGIGTVGLFALYLFFAARVHRIMEGMPGYTSRRVWVTHLVLLVSATAGVIIYGFAYTALSTPSGAEAFARQPWSRYFDLISGLVIPIHSLLTCVYLAVLYERITGGVASLEGVMQRALGALWPMVIGFAVVMALCYLAAFLAAILPQAGGQPYSSPAHLATSVVYSLFFLVPVILIVEQCSLWRALVLNVRFIWTYLWRYIAFVLLACALFSLPNWIVCHLMGWGTGWAFHPVIDLLTAVLSIIFITLSFRYYIREAGTRDEEGA